MASLRRAFDGTGPYTGLAVACWLVGVVMLSAILMSPNGWQWWMDVHSVTGQEQDGLVYYSVNGARHSINDPNSFAGSRPAERTVYYLASDPGAGSLHNTANEALDWGITAGPGALGLALLARGFIKRRRIRETAQEADLPDSYGHGIPSETIKAIVWGEAGRRPKTQ